jgi:HAD superfamily hydrolase (TIGR01509 family)
MMPGSGRRETPGRDVRPKECGLEDSLTTPNPDIRALLLDFDGLIVDTETPIFEIWQGLYESHGQHLELDDWQHALGTHGGFDPVAHLARLTGQALDAEALTRLASERNQEACRALELLPGVARLLDDAGQLDFRLAVASSSPAEWVEGWLARHGIRERFGAVCAREHVAHVKPAPDLFLLAAESLRVAPHACLVFEDSPNGLRAARAAGMRCVAVPSGVTRTLALPPCDLVLHSLDEVALATILERLAAAAPRRSRPGAAENDTLRESGTVSLVEVRR